MAGKRKRPEPQATDSEDSHGEGIEVPDEPPVIDPYNVLDVDKTATAEQIRSAYRRLALKHHPDKAADSDKAAAHVKFQEVAAAYAVLSDEVRRKRYDATGRLDEGFGPGEDGDFDWTTFYRDQYESAVSIERIQEFAKQYKGSDEEKDDVLAAFEKVKGNMRKLYEYVMLSDPDEDDERFRATIDAAIASKEVEAYPKYAQETAKDRRKWMQKGRNAASDEAREAEELAEELGLKDKKKKNSNKKNKGDDIGNLAALIQKRQQGRAASFFDDLEAKYGGGSGKKTKIDHPPEEAFARNAKKKA